MENIENSQIRIDLRQSAEWAKFLSSIGWTCQETALGSKLYMQLHAPLKVAKVQKSPFLTKQDVDEIEEICKKHNVLFLKIEPVNDQIVPYLVEQGFLPSQAYLTPPATLQIDLKKSQEELWKDLSHSAKYSIKRAEREKVRVEMKINPSEKDLKTFYDMERETSKKKKFIQQSFDLLLKKNELFGKHSYLSMAYNAQGELCSGKYYLGFNNHIWYFHGGTTEAGRKDKSGYKIVWEDINFFKNQGFESLDFEGIDDSRFPTTSAWGGFSHFKEKFGGIEVRYPFPYVKYYSRFLRLVSKFTPIQA